MSLYSWLKCFKSQPTTQYITRFVENIRDRENFTVEQIVSDRGTQFTSQEYTQWAETKNIRTSKGSVYHPQTDGITERAMKSWMIKGKIATAQNKNHWYQTSTKAT
jgi:transposase InsO family protein